MTEGDNHNRFLEPIYSQRELDERRELQREELAAARMILLLILLFAVIPIILGFVVGC